MTPRCVLVLAAAVHALSLSRRGLALRPPRAVACALPWHAPRRAPPSSLRSSHASLRASRRFAPPPTPARSQQQAERSHSTKGTFAAHRFVDNPRHERDACGIGFLAEARGHASRGILDGVLEGLARMRHRHPVLVECQRVAYAGARRPRRADRAPLHARRGSHRPGARGGGGAAGGGRAPRRGRRGGRRRRAPVLSASPLRPRAPPERRPRRSRAARARGHRRGRRP